MTGDSASITHEGVQMSSNHMSADDMRSSLGIAEELPAATNEAPPAEPAAPEVPVEPVTESGAPKPEKLKSKDAAARIAQGTFEREEAKREAAAAKEEARLAREEAAAAKVLVEELRARGRKPAEAPAERKAPVDTDPEPQFEDFEKEGPLQYEKWLQAQTRWGARQEYQAQRQRDIQESRERARERSEHAANQRLAGTVRELMADPDVAPAMQRVMIPGDPKHPVTAAIMQSEVQPALIRHLAQHPEELAKILAIPSPLAQFKAMTRIEAQIEFSTKAATPAPTGSGQPRQTSNAHPPINPVGASHVSPASGPPDPETASQEEFDAYWNKQEREARGRK